MGIRPHFPFNGKRFIGNTNSNQVHDLTKEDTSESGCQIDEIKVQHVKKFYPDTLEQALKEKFDKCNKCLGD